MRGHMKIDVTQNLLTAAEAAKYLRCSLRTLDRERAAGRGCPFVRMGRRIRYRREDIEAFVAAHLRGHVPEALSQPASAQSRRRSVSTHVASGGVTP
jgi:excisionase family DNA binding protein